MKRTLAATVALALAALATSTAAGASSGLPKTIEQHLNLHYAPPCSLCHDQGKTGGGTVVTPFGWSARARGLTSKGTAVNATLDTMKADGVDSDGDGVGDVDELVAGTDPNAAGAPMDNGSEPGFGCGAKAQTPRGALVPFAPWLVLGAAAALRRRKRSVGARPE